MADFNNLLNDGDDDYTQRLTSESASIYEEDTVNAPNYIRTTTSTVADNETQQPVALAEAETIRRRFQVAEDIDAIEDSKSLDQAYSGLSLHTDHIEAVDESEGANPDYEKLKSLWVQELNAPDLLPYDSDTISDLTDLLDQCHEETLTQLRSQARPHGVGRNHEVDPGLASLAASICQMDADRLAFLLSDLCRIRLHKIERFALHNRDVLDRMSDLEREYLLNYGLLWEKHMKRTVISHLPKDIWKKLDEPDMIDHPDLDSYVFCKVIHEEGVQIDSYLGYPTLSDLETSDEDYDDRIQEYTAGTCLFLRYALVRDLILEGKVVLLT